MTRDVHSLEAEYEPEHGEADERVVIGASEFCTDGTDDTCASLNGDPEMKF